jgi:hypothetical protein
MPLQRSPVLSVIEGRPGCFVNAMRTGLVVSFIAARYRFSGGIFLIGAENIA